MRRLKAADVGVAMGLSGRMFPVTRPTSCYRRQLRALSQPLKKVAACSTTSGSLQPTYHVERPRTRALFAFVLLRIPLPLTIIQVLAVTSARTCCRRSVSGPNALDPEVMRRPPRTKHHRLIDYGLIVVYLPLASELWRR
jgi:hypothetical protein